MNSSMSAQVTSPVPPPLNERLLAALSRLETCVLRTEVVLARLRDTGQSPGPDADLAAAAAPNLPAHEIVGRFEENLNKLENRLEATITIL